MKSLNSNNVPTVPRLVGWDSGTGQHQSPCHTTTPFRNTPIQAAAIPVQTVTVNDGASLLYGLGHISNVCDQIDKLLQ